MGADATTLRLATRGSALALAQAHQVLAACSQALPGRAVEIKIIKTTGDKLQAVSLADAALPKGLFTKELEVALLNGEADFAVHSLKDLPTELPPGLTVGAVLPRADVRDVLLHRATTDSHAEPRLPLNVPGGELVALRQGAVLGTSSTRRHAQIQALRPDLQIVPIRGNVPTRLRKVAASDGPDGIILALAGLRRLNFQVTAEGYLTQDAARELEGHDVPAGLRATILSLDTMLPCVGQGAIALEVRQNDERVRALCALLNDPDSERAVTAERAFLRRMGGGCQLAVAAYAEVTGGSLRMRAASYLGRRPRRGDINGPLDPTAAGEAMADQLRAEAD